MTRKIALEVAITIPATKDYLAITVKVTPSEAGSAAEHLDVDVLGECGTSHQKSTSAAFSG